MWLLSRSISTYQRFGQRRSPGRRGGLAGASGSYWGEPDDGGGNPITDSNITRIEGFRFARLRDPVNAAPVSVALVGPAFID